MFPDNICQNSDIQVVMNVQKKKFGFHSNQKNSGTKASIEPLMFQISSLSKEIKTLRYLHPIEPCGRNSEIYSGLKIKACK